MSVLGKRSCMLHTNFKGVFRCLARIGKWLVIDRLHIDVRAIACNSVIAKPMFAVFRVGAAINSELSNGDDAHA